MSSSGACSAQHRPRHGGPEGGDGRRRLPEAGLGDPGDAGDAQAEGAGVGLGPAPGVLGGQPARLGVHGVVEVEPPVRPGHGPAGAGELAEQLAEVGEVGDLEEVVRVPRHPVRTRLAPPPPRLRMHDEGRRLVAGDGIGVGRDHGVDGVRPLRRLAGRRRRGSRPRRRPRPGRRPGRAAPSPGRVPRTTMWGSIDDTVVSAGLDRNRPPVTGSIGQDRTDGRRCPVAASAEPRDAGPPAPARPVDPVDGRRRRPSRRPPGPGTAGPVHRAVVAARGLQARGPRPGARRPPGRPHGRHAGDDPPRHRR